MEERLITRFKWGMVAELEKPTVELRKNILRNKIHRDGLQFPQEVIDYIAENVGDRGHRHFHYGAFHHIQ
jgi:chromosomal replication initiator protein